MRLSIKSIFALAAIAFVAACTPIDNPEVPDTPQPEDPEKPIVEKFTLDIKVTDITSYDAVLTITPSNDEASYACVFLSMDQLPVFEEQQDTMLAIMERFDPVVLQGEYSEMLTPLMPGTEYVVVAFGVEGSTPTSDLFEYRFTSVDAEAGSVYIESIEIVKLFDCLDVIALDSSWASSLAECECVAIVEAKTNIPTDKLYFWWYEGWMLEEYNDEVFLEDLLMYDYANNPEIMDMYYSMDDQDMFLFAGVAEDEDGNLSEIFYGEPFVLSKDMCDPAEEFFTYVSKAPSTAMLFCR